MTTVAFGCMHACGGAPDDVVLPLPCAGRLDLATLLRALARGLDGAMVLGCAPAECRHRRCDEGAAAEGTPCAASGAGRVSAARALISAVGLSPLRIAHRVIRPGDDAGALVRAWAEAVARLGPWARVPLPPAPDDDARAFAPERCAGLLARVQAMRGWRAGEGAARAGADGDVLWLGCGEVRAAALGEPAPSAALELWRLAGRTEGAVLRSRCCGRPLAEAGEREPAAALALANAACIAITGARRLVAPCPGCVGALAAAAPGIEVIGLAEWAAEAVPFAPGRAEGPLALVASGPIHAAVEERLARAGVARLEAPAAGLRGPELRAAVDTLLREAASQGAAAIVAASPHDGALWRAALGPGGWRTGPAMPILDVPEALLRLASPAGASGARKETGAHA